MEMFRPHIMTWTVLGPSTKNAKGYPIPGTPGEPISIPCRFISGGGKSGIKEFINEDNSVVKQIGQIRIDAGEQYPKDGQIVTVTEGDKVHFTGKIRSSYLGGQLGKWRFEV